MKTVTVSNYDWERVRLTVDVPLSFAAREINRVPHEASEAKKWEYVKAVRRERETWKEPALTPPAD